jgi:hypothetical protein
MTCARVSWENGSRARADWRVFADAFAAADAQASLLARPAAANAWSERLVAVIGEAREMAGAAEPLDVYARPAVR